VEAVRDFAQADVWGETQTSSLAQPGASRPMPRLGGARFSREEIARRRRIVRQTGYGVVVALLLGGILATALAGYGPRPHHTVASAILTRTGGSYIDGPRLTRSIDLAVASRGTKCPQVAHSTGYVNPLVGATVKPERIDQGVDYAGSGALVAIGDARLTYVATENTGWPGAFIEYRLLNGPDAGCSVFYAEGVTPRAGLRIGRRVNSGEVLATIIPRYPTGFEVGWGAGVDTQTYAVKVGHWTADDDQNNVATVPGRSFSALIAALGGPPGKVEGPPGESPHRRGGT
jgi:hypothetical protein